MSDTPKCDAECHRYSSGEIRHVPTCPNYAGSLSEIHDNLVKAQAKLAEQERCRVSGTPRTDNAESHGFNEWGGDQTLVPADFARQLERELAEKDKRIAELEDRIASIQTANRRAEQFNGVINDLCNAR